MAVRQSELSRSLNGRIMLFLANSGKKNNESNSIKVI